MEAITSVTGRLINEPLSLSAQFEGRGHGLISGIADLFAFPSEPSKYHARRLKRGSEPTLARMHHRRTRERPPRHDITAARAQRPGGRAGGRVGGTRPLLLRHLLTANENLSVSGVQG